MVQGFLSTFPQYHPSEGKAVDINLSAENYGGRHGPIFAEIFEEQNQRRYNGSLNQDDTVPVHLVSLDLVNGGIDSALQVPEYIKFANGNTYGVQAVSDEDAEFYLNLYEDLGKYRDLLARCTAAVADGDPDGEGDSIKINRICATADMACAQIESMYYYSNRRFFDLAAPNFDPFPPQAFQEYISLESI